MSMVNDFYQVTIELLTLLEKNTGNDRDVKINKIQTLLEQREGFMNMMKPPFSQKDRDLGKDLIELNQKVNELLIKEKIMIQRDIKSLNQQKNTAIKYNNPYDALSSIDGVFYDKRK